MQLLLLLLACVLVPRAETGKIIGGQEARPHTRPYMAYVTFVRYFSCGGFLIHEDFVLTAAHCLGSFMNVTLGAHDINQNEETQQFIRVKRAIPHPDYNGKIWLNDIMLLQLEKKAKLTNAIDILQLPKTETQGDSGGPLICDNVAQGIVSYGLNDASPPRVETKVTSYLKWIKKTIKSLQMKKSDEPLYD